MKTPKSFAAALSQTRLPSVFNPYRDCCPVHDRLDAARVRKRNLVRCFEAALAARIDTIWIARDLGYRGGRRTGIPLTDEIHLSQAGVLLGGIALDRATRGPVVAERTAAIIWSVLSHIGDSVAQRFHTDFSTDARFDNPRAVQIRLPGLDLDALVQVGARVRDLFAEQATQGARIRAIVNNAYLEDLARAVAGRLGGRAGVAPRIFLKKLVGDVLDRVDQFADFDPRRHYAPTIDEQEMSLAERASAGAASVDDVELGT